MKTVLSLLAAALAITVLVSFESKPNPVPEPAIGQIKRECLEFIDASLCTVYFYTENGWAVQPRGPDHLISEWLSKNRTKKWPSELTEL